MNDPCVNCPYFCNFNGCMLPDYCECPLLRKDDNDD